MSLGDWWCWRSHKRVSRKSSENKENAGNGSKAICRVSNVLRSPSPDFQRWTYTQAASSDRSHGVRGVELAPSPKPARSTIPPTRHSSGGRTPSASPTLAQGAKAQQARWRQRRCVRAVKSMSWAACLSGDVRRKLPVEDRPGISPMQVEWAEYARHEQWSYPAKAASSNEQQ